MQLQYKPGIGKDFGQCHHVAFVRMDAAIREQAQQMHDAAAFFHRGDEMRHLRIVLELALVDCRIDTRQILHHHAAGANIGVADLGISHLVIGQSHVMLARLHLGVRRMGEEFVPVRRLGEGDRVVIAVAALAPAVENTEHQRARRGDFRHGGFIEDGRRQVKRFGPIRGGRGARQGAAGHGIIVPRACRAPGNAARWRGRATA